MKSRRASRRSSAEPRRVKAASVAASSHRRRVGRNTIAGRKLYEPSAVNNVAGGISGIRSFIVVDKYLGADGASHLVALQGQQPRDSIFRSCLPAVLISCPASETQNAGAPAAHPVV